MTSPACEPGAEFGYVGNHTVDAEFIGRVGIGDGVQSLVLGTLIAAGPLRHSNEEALIGRYTVGGLESLILGGAFPCEIGQEGSAEIGDIFAERQLARGGVD